MHSTFFFLDPYYTFFSTNYSFIMKVIPPKFEYAPLLPGIKVTPLIGFGAFMGQTVVFYFLACLIDYCRVNRFRYADNNVPRCEQPRLTVHEDVKT